jgi:hypothetical protein
MPGWAGMPSGAGRGRCASGSLAEGWECSGPGEAGGGVDAPVPEGDGVSVLADAWVADDPCWP